METTNTGEGLAALTVTVRAMLNPDGIPAELKTLPQWVCWRYSQRNGKATKPPINPLTGRAAEPNGPTT